MKRLRGRACRLRVQRQRDIKDRGVFVELQIIESGWRIMCIYACVWGGCVLGRRWQEMNMGK